MKVVYPFRAVATTSSTPIELIKGIRKAGQNAIPEGKRSLFDLLMAKRAGDVFRAEHPDRYIDAVQAEWFPDATSYLPGGPLYHRMQLTFFCGQSFTNDREAITYTILVEEVL